MKEISDAEKELVNAINKSAESTLIKQMNNVVNDFILRLKNYILGAEQAIDFFKINDSLEKSKEIFNPLKEMQVILETFELKLDLNKEIYCYFEADEKKYYVKNDYINGMVATEKKLVYHLTTFKEILEKRLLIYKTLTSNIIFNDIMLKLTNIITDYIYV